MNIFKQYQNDRKELQVPVSILPVRLKTVNRFTDIRQFILLPWLTERNLHFGSQYLLNITGKKTEFQ